MLFGFVRVVQTAPVNRIRKQNSTLHAHDLASGGAHKPTTHTVFCRGWATDSVLCQCDCDDCRQTVQRHFVKPSCSGLPGAWSAYFVEHGKCYIVLEASWSFCF